MDLLSSLGVDITFFYQLGIFLVGYLILYNLVFKPYCDAHFERINRTVGNMESNDRVLADIQHLKTDHETKARKLNDEYRTIYDAKRTEALEEYDKIVSEARRISKEQIEGTRSLIQSEVTKTKTGLEKEVPVISELLVGKLLK